MPRLSTKKTVAAGREACRARVLQTLGIDTETDPLVFAAKSAVVSVRTPVVDVLEWADLMLHNYAALPPRPRRGNMAIVDAELWPESEAIRAWADVAVDAFAELRRLADASREVLGLGEGRHAEWVPRTFALTLDRLWTAGRRPDLDATALVLIAGACGMAGDAADLQASWRRFLAESRAMDLDRAPEATYLRAALRRSPSSSLEDVANYLLSDAFSAQLGAARSPQRRGPVLTAEGTGETDG